MTTWTAFEHDEVRFFISGVGVKWQVKVEDYQIELIFDSFQRAYDYAIAYINAHEE